MDYARTIPFRGDLGKTFEAAMTILAPHGFVVTGKKLSTIEFAGPGLRNTRQPPVLGASLIILEGDHNRLSLQAELGGVAAMRRFLIYFPLGMAVAFALFFGLAFPLIFDIGFDVPALAGWNRMALAMLMSVLPLSPWLVLSPLLARRTKNRTIQALDALLSSIDTAGARREPARR